MEMTMSTQRRRRWRSLVMGLLVLGGLTTSVDVAVVEGPHARCAVAQTRPEPARRLASYQVPDVELIRADGARVSLRREIDDGRPVILNFVFTSCTAICPVMTQIFAQIQRRLGNERDKVHMVSVSIDPEQDTPARLREYAERFQAGPQWSFYTGTLENSLIAQRAFDAYRGNKMNHVPVTFLRRAPGQPWVRLEGFIGADDVVQEYRQLLATR
jgi:protein SCO1/2